MTQRTAGPVVPGARYGHLLVLSRAETPRRWKCRCDCGNTKPVRADHLRTGATKSCGCGMAPPRQDLTGRKVGRLTVRRPAPDSADGRTRWVCECQCGQETTVYTFALNAASTLSCGCLIRDTLHARRGEHRTDRTTYRTAHKRVEAVRGKATAHRCTDCGTPATEWSYDHTDPQERVQVVRGFALTYSTKTEHYQPRCLPCHRTHDGAPGWEHARG